MSGSRPQRILIVRTTSMGDLVHTLPAVSDVAAHFPEAAIDWVAEAPFAEIPTWHPAVRQVIPVELRRWRHGWYTAEVRRAWRQYRASLRAEPYDAVVDLQGLIKSAALVAWQARGERHGLDRHSAREPLAALWYERRHAVARMQPAVHRYRTLMGLALGYEPEGEPDFGLQRLLPPQTPSARDDDSLAPLLPAQNYVTIMPSASRDRKLWPEDDWQAILQQLLGAGRVPLLLAGNDAERERAERLAAATPGARVLPRLSLRDTARVLAAAEVMVGLDSGVTHLAAALGRPTIGIYCATPVVRTPICGPATCFSLGDRGDPPSRQEVADAVEALLTDSLRAQSPG